MLKRVWKREKKLKERVASTHSQCNTCSDIDVHLGRLHGVPGEHAMRERKFLLRAKQEHEVIHLSCRSVFDDYGFQAVINPSAVWCICCDAMTAKTVELPRYNSRKYRLPKAASAGLPKWGFKLTATYCFGYGFIPFISHDSLSHGPNLVWTVIWESICRLRRHHGNYPDVLFILLDNTTGENKTDVMFAMGAWLVATGRVKQVRIFFLMVGHTHIIIDQIFGVISVNLRGKEILLPEELIKLIDASMAKNPTYKAQPTTWLRCLYDFWGWSKQMDLHRNCAEGAFKRQGLTDEEGTYSGMYDFIFNPDKEHLALMQYRERHDFPLRPAGGNGVPTIQKLPVGPPSLAQVKPFESWGKISNKTIRDTIDTYLGMARSVRTIQEEERIRAVWDRHIKAVPTIIELLPAEHKLVFNDFAWSPDVPRLTHNQEHGQEQEQEQEHDLDEESEYKVWCKVFFSGVRNTPFAYDPVTSKVQPASAYRKERAAYEQALLGGVGPTTSPQSLVLGGRNIFFRASSDGSVYLAKIEHIGRGKTPRSPDVKLLCSHFTHSPQPGVAGFFGTFRAAPAGTGKAHIMRDSVLVYNAELCHKTKQVSLATLRQLALCLP